MHLIVPFLQHPLYLAAVQQRLLHPNRHMAVHDVGERTVDPTDYRGGIEEYMSVREWYELRPLPQVEVNVTEDESSSNLKDGSESESENSSEDSLDVREALAQKEAHRVKKAKARQPQHFKAKKAVKVPTKPQQNLKPRHKIGPLCSIVGRPRSLSCNVTELRS